jgi:hypothetical protein
VKRGFKVLTEVAAALPRDFVLSLTRRAFSPLRMEDGARPATDPKLVAMYVHYSASGRISEMVRIQVESLRQSGFAVVFITMATNISEADWQSTARHCAVMVQRRNFGLDFGAWRDLMPEIRRRWQVPEELLLANDSVLGPIYPLSPIMDAMRSSGDGLYGLSESLQGGPHLQSYMLLARGRPVVQDLMRFLETLPISHSNWLLVQLGEMRLARWMRRRGHRVAALFGYRRLVEVALSDQPEPVRLAKLLNRRPLNPTHHLWRVLVTEFGSPFIKTELVYRNPGRLPKVTDWPELVPPTSPVSVEVIREHLETLRTA